MPQDFIYTPLFLDTHFYFILLCHAQILRTAAIISFSQSMIIEESLEVRYANYIRPYM